MADVEPFTMTGPERRWALVSAVNYLLANGIKGDFVECGVWKGGSAMLMMKAAMAQGGLRRIWLYDTFDGMTAPTKADREAHTGRLAEDLLTDARLGEHYRACVSFDEVSANLATVAYPRELVQIIPGDVVETLRDQLPKEICLLRLDTDWYESTLFELEQLYPRVVTGGVVIVDDYGHFSGAREAVDRYLSSNGLVPLLFRVDYTARMWIKP